MGLLRWRLGCLMRLLQLPLQALNAVLRLGQRMFLHKSELRQPVRGLRQLLEQVVDVLVSLRVDGRQWRLCRGCGAVVAGTEPPHGDGAWVGA